MLAKSSELKFFIPLISLVDHFNFNRITQNPLKKSVHCSLKLTRCQRLTSVNQLDFKWLPKSLKTLFFILLKRCLFHTFNNITSNCKKSTILALWRTSFPTAKKVSFCAFYEIAWDRKKQPPPQALRFSHGRGEREWLVMNRKGPLEGYRCLLPPFLCAHIFIKRETSGYESGKKVPLSRFKSSFGKVRNGWKANNINVKMSFTRKLKIPDFFFIKKYLFLSFNLNDNHRKKGNNFAVCSTENECRNLVFLPFWTSTVDLFVKKVELPESFTDCTDLTGLAKTWLQKSLIYLLTESCSGAYLFVLFCFVLFFFS